MPTSELGLQGVAPTVTVRPATPEEQATALTRDAPTVESLQRDLRAANMEIGRLAAKLVLMKEALAEARATLNERTV